MKKHLIWILALGMLCLGAYVWHLWPDKIPFWRTTEKADARKTPARPSTAIVSTRDINFAITAAGEITPA